MSPWEKKNMSTTALVIHIQHNIKYNFDISFVTSITTGTTEIVNVQYSATNGTHLVNDFLNHKMEISYPYMVLPYLYITFKLCMALPYHI